MGCQSHHGQPLPPPPTKKNLKFLHFFWGWIKHWNIIYLFVKSLTTIHFEIWITQLQSTRHATHPNLTTCVVVSKKSQRFLWVISFTLLPSKDSYEMFQKDYPSIFNDIWYLLQIISFAFLSKWRILHIR